MKSILDDSKKYDQYDPSQVGRSFTSFGQQMESAWHDSQFVNLGFETDHLKNIVIAGMGGSNLAAFVAQSLSPLLIKLPFEIVANYRLPQYADKNTLVILASYSGNTEEIISCAQDALKRQCKIVVLTTSGKLKEMAITEHWPMIALDSKLNPSRVPRYGLGLMLGATLGLLVRLNPESYRYFDLKEIVRTIDRGFDHSNINISSENNPAKTLALKNKGQSIIFISANHLTGVAKIASNFVCETSKTFSASFVIPDINHFFMEGLSFPESLKDNTRFILLNSSLYPEIIQKRFQITKDILVRQKYQLTVIKPEATDIVLQVFESLVFLTMFSYYLSIANKQDPSTNPWVDYFKKQII